MSARRPVRLVAVTAVAALALAACGDDDDPEASGGTAAAAATPTTAAAGASAGSDGGGGGAAATPASAEDGIAALCPAEDAPDDISLAIWPGHRPIIEGAVAGFTELTGVEVEWVEGPNGDRLTKLNAERGSPTIDVAMVPVNEVPLLLQNEVILPTDESIPGYDTLTEAARIDGGYGTSLLQFGIAYNPKFVTEPPDSWMDLFDPQWAGRMAFPAMPNSGGYATLAMIARSMGGDETDLAPAIERVAEAKGDIAEFYPFAPAMEPRIIGEEIWIYPDIGGAVSSAAARGVPVEFVVPEEGGPNGVNVAVIPEGVESEGCSKAFVSWLLSEDVQTSWAEGLFYFPTNESVELSAEVQDKVHPQDESTLVQLDWPTVARNVPQTMDLWNREVLG